MSLLIALAIIGGITGLVALYVLGTYLVAAIIGHTQLFKEKICAVINDYRAKRKAKNQQTVEQPVVQEEENQ